MASILLTVEVEGAPYRYTTADEPETVAGDIYRPGLDVKSVKLHDLGQTTAKVYDPAEDWPSILLPLSVPPVWPARLSWYDGGEPILLQIGIAKVQPYGRPAGRLGLSIDSATFPGARMVPDSAGSLVVRGDWPSIGHTGVPDEFRYGQAEEAIGIYYPRVYGAPGPVAIGPAAAVTSPGSPAYACERFNSVSEGANGPGAFYTSLRVVIAAPPSGAASVQFVNVSEGADNNGRWVAVARTPFLVRDLRGRTVEVVDFGGIIGLPWAEDAEWAAAWTPADPATPRDAEYIVADMLRASGRPVDLGRLHLPGFLLDFALVEPVDPIEWSLQHLGSVALYAGRTGSGFYLRLIPVDQVDPDMELLLDASADYGDLSPADPSTIPSDISVRYGVITGETTAEVRLTATGDEDGATRSPMCARAYSAGYRSAVEEEVPAVRDPTTAARIANLIALDRCNPGVATVVDITDEGTIRTLLELGPAHLVRLTDATDDAVGLTGYLALVESMAVSESALQLTLTVRPA